MDAVAHQPLGEELDRLEVGVAALGARRVAERPHRHRERPVQAPLPVAPRREDVELGERVSEGE